MNNDSTSKYSEDIGFMRGPQYVDMFAKIHAMDLHQSRGTPADQLPRINDQELKKGRELAWERILLALKYFEEEKPNDETDKDLLNAAQLLEKLFLNRPLDTLNRVNELHMAGLAYYLSGYYARAYVLMRGVTDSDDGPTNLMKLLFLRKLSQIKDVTLEVLSQRKFIDAPLANSVRQGDIDDSEAVECALEGTLNRIFLFLHEYARTGQEDLIDRAESFLRIGLQLAIEQHLEKWWWIFQCTISLVREYHRNSLWFCLRSMLNEDQSQLVKNYIKAAFSRDPFPVLELWRSQSHVVENINDNKSYCLKMPTSSGKTRIAELAILKFLIETREENDKKCIYIAPYRALAVELEQSLRRSFEPIGIGVSQLYGSYDLNPAESLLVDEAKILIATPEKIDAFLRYNTEVAQKIGLIIVDEGHIIDSGERGLRYELFLHRLIKRYERNGVRMLFISAVMPNAEQFATWITGRGSDAVLESDWRATQLLLGVLSWDGVSGRVDYTHRDQDEVDQSFFISNYFRKFDPDVLRAAKCGHQKYPKKNPSRSVLTAMAAVKTTSEGPTLVFTPQKNNVESIAKMIIEVVELQERINQHLQQSEKVLPINTDTKEKFDKLARCIRDAEETTGANSIIVRSLKSGFVIHHGGVPRSLRLNLEELIREGILQLVVANTTLAQGVNLPVKTILIHSLYNNKELLKSRDFWNLCGRAGRAMYETEGHIYVMAGSKQEYQDARKKINGYINQKNSEEIISSIRVLMENMVEAWQDSLPQFSNIDIAELCQVLTNDDENWLNIDVDNDWLKTELRRKLRILDTQILALAEEQHLNIMNTEDDLMGIITELFKDSIMYAQMSKDAETYISSTQAISLIVQRIEHISRICKTKQRRQRYYSMSLSIEGCASIENRSDDLADYLKMAEDFMNWSPDERADYIIKLCAEYLLQIDDIRVSSDYKEPPDCWSQILKSWLMGQNAVEIMTNNDLPVEWKDPMKISTFIDDLCDFRLPWGLNALSMFWKVSNSTSEEIDETLFVLPEAVNYFASMLRFGVHNPIATVALALGLGNRKAALSLSQLYTGTIDEISILQWMQNIDQKDVTQCTSGSASN